MKTRTSSNSVGRVYDDFDPSNEYSENHEAHFLQILLPGFKREQLNISFMHFTRTLNISGERQIDGENDKWLRFNQSYPIPENCEEEKLQANFAHGVLTITMPKKYTSQQSPKTEAQQKKQKPRPERKTQEDISQKAQEMPPRPRLEEPKPDKAQEKTPQKYSHAQVEEPRPKKAQERMEGLKPGKAHDEHIPQGSTPSKWEEQKPEEAQEEEIPFKFRIPRGKEDLIQKIVDNGRGLKDLGSQEPTKEPRPTKTEEEETEPKPTITKPQRKPIDETEQRPTFKVAPKKPKDEKGGEEIDRESEGKLAGKAEKMFQEKEIRTRKRTAEKGSLLKKEDMVSTIGKGMREVSASTSEVVTKISEGKWKEEEKPMLVNMGAAILVIAALGVYVSYKLTSSGDA
ncbi:hypothetical protein QN277_009323 [Acacia crassicarpa]|uniref:SHSP domain-containing protein n=1 Tax=Acacia crassicarpa TaxID=499986 RepID=A0AAE1ME02_9FABA|nr:hypothetical protein QN277_009323 [Acacia crassicarpa]